MSAIDASLRSAAEQALALRIPGTDRADTALIEHGGRVALNAALILRVVDRTLSADVDPEALTAGAMFYCGAWAVQYEDGSVDRSDVLSKPLSDVQLELSATRATEALRGLLTPRRLEQVCQIIRESGLRNPLLPAAQILSEAINLDQIGPLGWWQSLRKHFAEGRGVTAALTVWDRQREYNFWHARIKDGFRFDPVKQLAEQRLAALDQFMQALGRQSAADDLAALAGVHDAGSVVRSHRA